MTVAAWAAWIAAAAVIFSAAQVTIALHKLRFDLFAKRFEAWEAANNAMAAWRTVMKAVTIEAPEESDGGEARRAFWRARQQMTLLFPPEVDGCLDRIQDAMVLLMQASFRARERATMPSREAVEDAAARYQAFLAADKATWDLQTELMALAFPYMRQFGWLEATMVPWSRRLWSSISPPTISTAPVGAPAPDQDAERR